MSSCRQAPSFHARPWRVIPPLALLSASTLLSGCRDTPPVAPGRVIDPALAVTPSGTPVPVLEFLPPTVPSAPPQGGPTPPGHRPVVTIICVAPGDSRCPTVARFERTTGGAPAPGITAPLVLQDLRSSTSVSFAFSATWKNHRLQVGDSFYRLIVTLGNDTLATMPLSVVPTPAGFPKVPPTHLAVARSTDYVIQFRIETSLGNVASVELAPSTETIAVGGTTAFVPTLRSQYGQVLPLVPLAWTSSAPAVATVASDGTVTGVSAGTATITGTVNGASASATVTVTGGAPADQLPGAPADPAPGAIPQRVVPHDISSYTTGHPDLPGMARSTKIVRVAIDRNATIGQVNAMLTAAQAKITGGVPGVAGAADGLLILELPTTSHAALDAARAAIAAFPGVLRASPDLLIDGTTLPSSNAPTNWTWEVQPLGGNWGLEEMRVPQMWNLSQLPPAVGSPLVDVTVLDVGFEPHQDISGSYTDISVIDDHGNHVAGILGANFSGGIQGVTPFAKLRLTPIQSVATMVSDMSYELSAGLTPRVMNLSLGYNWYKATPVVDVANSAAAQFVANVDGLDAALVILAAAARGQSIPYMFAAAGNDSNENGFGSQPARYASPFANAALHQGISQIIVVEAVDQTLTRASFSNAGGHLSGPGVGILSAVLSNGYGVKDGTSMATPHLAGLAAQVIALDPTFPGPTLTTNPMLALLGANTRTTTGAAAMPDAFATVLDIDRVQGGDRILRSLIDVDDGTQDGNERVTAQGSVQTGEDLDGNGTLGDGAITMADFRRFRDALLLVEGSALLALDGSSLHPKKDLNGDGQSAAPASENVYPRFDFNGDGIIDRTSRRQMRGALAGQNLTDLEVLMSRFVDSLYSSPALPQLLETGDAHFYAQSCAPLPGVTHLQLQVRDAQTQALVQGRIIPATNPAATLVVPSLPQGALLQVRALKPDLTTVVATDEMTVPLPLGGDVHFTPECADLSISNTTSLALPMGATGNVTFVVRDYDFVTGVETPLVNADITLSATGGTVTPLSTVTDNSGLFTISVTRSGSANVQLSVKAARFDGPFRFANFVIGNVSSFGIVTSYLPGGAESIPYTGAQLQAVGGSGAVTWSLASGSLPLGLTMSGSGYISGTPSPGSGNQTYNFTVQASSGGQTAQKALSIGISPPQKWVGGWSGTITRSGNTMPITFYITRWYNNFNQVQYYISHPFQCPINFTSPSTIVGNSCLGWGTGYNTLQITGDGFSLSGTVGMATFSANKVS